jgi:arsenical pump membrane protein
MNDKIIVEFIFILSILIMIFLIMRRPFFYIRLINRKIKLDTYIIGALLAPFLIIIFGLLNYSQIIGGLGGQGALNPFGVLVLFLSMVFMSIYLDITGFFEYCARIALKLSKNNGKLLFLSFYFVISILTIFTSNDIVILTFTPFIYYFTKHAKIDPIPYLIAEFFAANTWSMMLYIGNPTNIVLATAFQIDFLEYFKWMFLPSFVAGLTNLVLLYWVFRKRLQINVKQVKVVRPADALTDKLGAILGVVVLFGCIFFLALAPYFFIDLWVVSVGFAVVLLILLIIRDSYAKIIRKNIDWQSFKVAKTLRRMPIGIIPFVLAMFISVEALRVYGVTTDIGLFFKSIIGESVVSSVFLFGFSSSFLANIINNIPMTVAYVPIIQSSVGLLSYPAIFATVIGSNLGANITPLGALAGIMWITILRNKNVNFSFKEFIKYGLIITPLTLLVCLGVLALEFLIF